MVDEVVNIEMTDAAEDDFEGLYVEELVVDDQDLVWLLKCAVFLAW